MTALEAIPRVELTPDDDEFNAAILLNLQRSGRLTVAGLQLDDPDIPFETLEAIGRMLGQLRDMTAFALGDLVLFTEATHAELVGQLAEATGRSPDTLQNYVRVSTRVPFGRRVMGLDGLTWSHHEAVATLDPPDQDRLLARAQDQRWNVMELREAKRELLGQADDDPPFNEDVERIPIAAAARAVVAKGKRVQGGYLVGVRAFEQLRDAIDDER